MARAFRVNFDGHVVGLKIVRGNRRHIKAKIQGPKPRYDVKGVGRQIFHSPAKRIGIKEFKLLRERGHFHSGFGIEVVQLYIPPTQLGDIFEIQWVKL